jgi:hypothetical protein
MSLETTEGCRLPDFVPNWCQSTKKDEKKSPQESPYKAIYFLIQYPYPFSAKK